MTYLYITRSGKPVTGKTIRNLGQRLLNMDMVPEGPIDVLDHSSGEFVMKVRYNPAKDQWEKYVEGRYEVKEGKKTYALMPSASFWITVPATYLDGKVWPEHQIETTIPPHYVELVEEPTEVYTEAYWKPISNTKGIKKQYSPAEKLRMMKEET